MIARLLKKSVGPLSFSPPISRVHFGWVLVVGLVVLVAGCAIRSRDMVNYHTFYYPVPLKDSPAPIPDTIMIYRFLPAPSVNGRFLVVSRGKGKEESMTYHRWDKDPADMVTDLLQRDFEGAGLFRKTVGQSSDASYRYALEGKILTMEVVEKGGKSRAVMDVEALLTDFDAPLGTDKEIMQRRYRIEVPCRESTPAAMVEGLNGAVRELSKRLRRDIRAAVKRSTQPARARSTDA